jgi:tRNA(adenine34) deaminase
LTLTQHQNWMRQAIALADQACALGDVPVGAVLVSAQGELITQSHNTREVDLDITGHAEINVLKQAAQVLGSWRLDETYLYVTLEPCSMCLSAIGMARVSHVIYGAYDPKLGACGSKVNLLPLFPSIQSVTGGILEDRCKHQLQTFFKTKR